MENGLFFTDAIAPLLTNDYVEARLHTDGEKNIERILELRDELVGSPALPQYVLIDPATEEKLGHFAGFTRDIDAFKAFLESGL